jgi:hypothetical protein
MGRERDDAAAVGRAVAIARELVGDGEAATRSGRRGPADADDHPPENPVAALEDEPAFRQIEGEADVSRAQPGLFRPNPAEPAVGKASGDDAEPVAPLLHDAEAQRRSELSRRSNPCNDRAAGRRA